MTKYVTKQIAEMGAKGTMQEWLRMENIDAALRQLRRKIPVACRQTEVVANYQDGVDLDLEVSKLGDQLIELEVLLERAWVEMFGPGARIAYDFMRSDMRTDRLTRDTMSDFIASAAPSRSAQVAIKRKHLK